MIANRSISVNGWQNLQALIPYVIMYISFISFEALRLMLRIITKHAAEITTIT